MKKVTLSLLFVALLMQMFAQNQEAYDFKEPVKLSVTPVKSKDQTGTCWSFSTASFLESEALRLGKGEHDLSEMFVVRHVYRQKCENYVRRQGTAQFSEGGLAHDLLNAVEQYGIVPESIYPGRTDAGKPYNHQKLVKNLSDLCKGFVKQGKEGKLSENWLAEVDKALDEEFGPVPTQFTYNNTMFTPVSFREFLGIQADDYVSISSFTHHPFFEKFILEVPDNFANGQFYNLPLSEMMRSINYSLQQGYTVEWDADVSNAGFAPQNGLAIVPERSWEDKDAVAQSNTFKMWEPEKKISQELRQKLFDQQVTTDDHLMHIVGLLNESHGGAYFVVKNSWGEISGLKGFVNVSDAYMRQNTISFTVHKNALPKDIRRRLGLETPAGINATTGAREAKEAKTAPVSKPGAGKPKLDREQVKKLQDKKADESDQ
ncbi:MAG: aminopeptidase [Saprospiraceae bacterium]|nr:aminopeptidase [Saprospiraceae bacterium]